jgi:hypothetical protein
MDTQLVQARVTNVCTERAAPLNRPKPCVTCILLGRFTLDFAASQPVVVGSRVPISPISRGKERSKEFMFQRPRLGRLEAIGDVRGWSHSQEQSSGR